MDDGISKPGSGWEFFSSPPRPTVPATHKASYPMGTGRSFPGVRAAVTWSSALVFTDRRI